MSWSFYDWLEGEPRRAEIMGHWAQALQVAAEALELSGDREVLDEVRAGVWSLLLDVAQAEPLGLDRLEESVFALEQAELDLWLAATEALRDVLFELLADDAAEQTVERWRQIGPRLTRITDQLRRACRQQAMALEAEREHLRALNAVSRELAASMDLPYVLQKVARYVAAVVGADRGAVMVLDQESGQAIPRAGVNWSSGAVHLDRLPEVWRQGRGEPIILPDDGPDKHQALLDLLDEDTRSLVLTPLNANGQFHGLMALATSRLEGFSPQQLGLVRSATDQVAAAVGSAEIYRFLNDQARELGQMLRQQQEEASKSQAILASIADGVVVNDTRGEIILVNPAAERILGVSAAKLMGEDPRSLFYLFAAGEREVALKAMTALLADPDSHMTGGTDEPTAQVTLETEDRVVSAHLAPVQSRQAAFLGIVTVFRDITKEFEADRAKSEFVSTVSHELRTPMTAIKGYTDLLASEMVGELSEEQKRFLTIVRNNTDRLTALINDLLDISRVESGRVRFEPRMIQVGNVVKNVVEVLAGQAAAKGHALVYSIPDDLPPTLADADRLTQVLTNLVSNAIHYTPNDGRVCVNVYQVTNTLRIDVVDNGIGIPEEDLSCVFERFYRGSHPVVRESGGTGLGLSIAKMFVEMHGGRMWVQSEPGVGSTFTVLLPLPVEKKEEPEEVWLEAAAKLDKPTILLADSDRDVVELVRLRLEGAGYQVISVGRGDDALEDAQRYRPDLVLLDVLLPDMNGLDVLKALKSDPTVTDIPVLMFSVVEDDGLAMELGAAGYLAKPASEPEMLAEIRSALARRARVLIVEDEPGTVEMIETALRRVGFAVAVGSNGYDAMSIARSWSPQVILLDLHLPGMDGFEVLTHLKRNEITRDIPVMAMSGRLTYQEVEERQLTTLGAAAFLAKPFSISHLLEKLDLVLLRR